MDYSGLDAPLIWILKSEEELLLGHILFAPVGLNKDCLSHDVSWEELVLGRA